MVNLSHLPLPDADAVTRKTKTSLGSMASYFDDVLPGNILRNLEASHIRLVHIVRINILVTVRALISLFGVSKSFISFNFMYNMG